MTSFMGRLEELTLGGGLRIIIDVDPHNLQMPKL